MRVRLSPPLAAALSAALVLAGCNLAPPYVRPPSAAPSATWPQGPAYAATQPGKASDLPWRDFVTDERLRQVVQLALDNNRDLRVAVLNIAEARALYRAQRSQLFPAINGTADATIAHASGASTASFGGTSTGSGGFDYQTYSLGVGVSAYELDFWGRIRNLSKQAREAVLANTEAARSTRISLISEVAQAWATYAADLEKLRVAQDTVKADEETLRLAQARFDRGIVSELDVRQAQTVLEQARTDALAATTQGAQDVNALTLLAGAPVAANLLPTGQDSTLATLADVPAGVSSDVLLDRPDVRQAEHTLAGYNANIGAARANFFPTITLTANGGTQSTELGGLFGRGTGVWSFAPALTLPIFDFGRNRANLDYAKAERDVAVAQYDKAVQTAFRETADALAGRGTASGQVASQERLVEAAAAALKLSQARYLRGIDTFLTTLDAQRTLYAAQQGLVTARLSRAGNLVTLYRVLGGGVR